MAPEIMSGKSYNKSTDIYSLGVVLFELMALVKPFTARTEEDLL